MINATPRLAQRVRNAELFADSDRCWILDFAMPGYCAGALRGRIEINAMIRPFPQQKASMPFDVSDQVNPFHRADDDIVRPVDARRPLWKTQPKLVVCVEKVRHFL
jgi:hypothetical protein